MELWVATGNAGKLTEIKNLLHSRVTEKGWVVRSQRDLAVFTPRPENGKTFLENAQIKTRAVAAVQRGVWVIGEDSGLEVEGLGGLPGLHSARYAGPKASDPENVAKLLKMMALKPMASRRARFVCTLVAISPEGTESHFTGELQGEIAKAQKGGGGFGYDPVFLPLIDGAVSTQTLAELGSGAKNRISHRAAALRAFLASIEGSAP